MPHHYLFLQKSDRFRYEIQAWIHNGGDPNVRHAGDGRTLVHEALEHLDIDALFLLADRGADLNVLDGDGRAPIHHALDYDVDVGECATLAWTRLLLMLGADPDARTGDGKTMAEVAERYGPVVRLLYEKAVATTRRRRP